MNSVTSFQDWVTPAIVISARVDGGRPRCRRPNVRDTRARSPSRFRPPFVINALACSRETDSKRGHERNRTPDRDLQTFRRGLRADEKDSLSAVRSQEVVHPRFCRVSRRAFLRDGIQFSNTAIREFWCQPFGTRLCRPKFGSMEAVVAGRHRHLRPRHVGADFRAELANGARQFYFYRLYCPEPRGNRCAMALVSHGSQLVLSFYDLS